MRSVRALAALLILAPLASAEHLDALQDDAGSGGDAGDTFGDATPLSHGSSGQSDGSYSGRLLADDDADWYSYRVRALQTHVHVTVEVDRSLCLASEETYHVALVDGAGQLQAEGFVNPCFRPQVVLEAYAFSVGAWRLAVATAPLAPAVAASWPPPVPACVPDDPLSWDPLSWDPVSCVPQPTIPPPLPVDYKVYLWCEPFCVPPVP